MVAAHGIGKGAAFLAGVFRCVLLPGEFHGFAAKEAVDAVAGTIEFLQPLVIFGRNAEEVVLHRVFRIDAHHDDAGFLVAIALTEDFSQTLAGGIGNGDCGI